MVIAGGQPGAGKTTVADLVQAALDRRGGAVRIGRDLYKVAPAATGARPTATSGTARPPAQAWWRVSRRQRCSATLTATGELPSP
jgi:ABC-type branched-subunit amino acid transport system ATPase component